jgi:hypothetical protein
MSDQVDRQAELSDRQRAIVRSQCDGMLEEAYRTILEAFSTAPTNMDVIEQSEAMVAEVQGDDDEL